MLSICDRLNLVLTAPLIHSPKGLESWNRACPVHWEEKQTRSWFTDVIQIQEVWHGQRHHQLHTIFNTDCYLSIIFGVVTAVCASQQWRLTLKGTCISESSGPSSSSRVVVCSSTLIAPSAISSPQPSSEWSTFVSVSKALDTNNQKFEHSHLPHIFQAWH